MTKIFKVPFADTGDKISPPDAIQPDGSVSYSLGYGFDYQRDTSLDSGGAPVDPQAKVFPREQHNGILNDITTAVGEIQGNGLAIWQSAGGPYPVNAEVRYDSKNWRSLVSNNSVTPVEGPSWTETSILTYSRAHIDSHLNTKALNGVNSDITSLLAINVRPSFNGNLAWDAGNFSPSDYIKGEAISFAGFLGGLVGGAPYFRHFPSDTIVALATAAGLAALLPKRSFFANDFIRIPDVAGGLMIQFGVTGEVIGSGGSIVQPFPTPFPNKVNIVLISLNTASGDSTSTPSWVRSKTLTSFTPVNQNVLPATFSWIAIGN